MTPTTRLMRTLPPSRLLRARSATTTTTTATLVNAITATATAGSSNAQCDPAACLRNCRCFAQVNDIDKLNREVWFTSSVPRYVPSEAGDHKQPDERTLQLGKTVRVLHDRLPTLLQTPLPGDILSPRISLHLFPSTHPHLPTVSGKIPYIAALWTSPVAWGRVPLVGNVKLTILSERMVRNGGSSNAVPLASREEKLIVKWKTCGKTKHRDGSGGVYRGVGLATKDPVDRIKEFISGASGSLSSGSGDGAAAHEGKHAEEEEFCGIFIFEFDGQGRLVKHTIEHTEEGGDSDRATRVVSVTDWLLGRINGKGKEDVPALAWCEDRPADERARVMGRSRRLS